MEDGEMSNLHGHLVLKIISKYRIDIFPYKSVIILICKQYEQRISSGYVIMIG